MKYYYYLLLLIKKKISKKKFFFFSIFSIFGWIIPSNIIISRPRRNCNFFKLLLRPEDITLRSFSFLCLESDFISAWPRYMYSWLAVSIKHSCLKSITKTIALAYALTGFISPWPRSFAHFILADSLCY